MTKYQLSITLNNKEIPVNLITKVYFSCPLYQGKLKPINEMTEELILCDKITDHKYIKQFMINWGCKAIMPEFLIPGFTYIGLGALLGHIDPIRHDLTQTLINSLSRHPTKVIKALWNLARSGKELDYYQRVWGILNRYGVSFNGVRDTGLIVTTSHKIALWPDPILKHTLANIDSEDLLWVAIDNHLSSSLTQVR